MSACLCDLLGLPCECPGSRQTRPHGTLAAVRRHYRHGEALCADCKQEERRQWQDAGGPARQARRERSRAA